MSVIRRDLRVLGSKSITNVATQITPEAVGGEFHVQAVTANTNPIFIGNADVSPSDGIILYPGDHWIFNVLDASKYYAIVSAGSEALNFSVEVDK